jgi:hypothetical protein
VHASMPQTCLLQHRVGHAKPDAPRGYICESAVCADLVRPGITAFASQSYELVLVVKSSRW